MDFIEHNIALLIDAENISTQYMNLIIDEANKLGKVTFKRVYGDWTTNQLNPWKQMCIVFGLTPVQQYSYTTGKNASDFTLIIDAMDILYRDKVDSFCIVSSDSDFTKLVNRLKEDNMRVYGMGESKTPISLVNACESFSYLDKMLQVGESKEEESVLNIEEEKKEKKTKSKSKSKNNSSEPVSSITALEVILHELKNIVNDSQDDDGWSYWGNVAHIFQRKFPGFHPRNYGENMKSLTFFKKKTEIFEFKQDKSSTYVKCID